MIRQIAINYLCSMRDLVGEQSTKIFEKLRATNAEYISDTFMRGILHRKNDPEGIAACQSVQILNRETCHKLMV